MKCISVMQPWAWLIVTHELTDAERKDVENRTWETKYRGPLLIHAGLKFDYSALDWLYDRKMDNIADRFVDHFGVRLTTGGKRTSITWNKIELGGIVGKANLDGIVDNSTSPWAMPGCKHWQVSGGKEVPFFPLRGRLGLWNESVCMICQQLKNGNCGGANVKSATICPSFVEVSNV